MKMRFDPAHYPLRIPGSPQWFGLVCRAVARKGRLRQMLEELQKKQRQLLRVLSLAAGMGMLVSVEHPFHPSGLLLQIISMGLAAVPA
ncbi:hypothetical protein D3C75_1070180 [compost metagenome]